MFRRPVLPKAHVQVRLNSTYIRARPLFRDMLRTPLAKSVVLTVVFGTLIIELMKSRRELELLDQTYESKLDILLQIKQKLLNDQYVDVQAELKIANSLTKYKYNTVTEIELDEQLENWLKLSESEMESSLNDAVNTEPVVEPKVVPLKESEKKSFL